VTAQIATRTSWTATNTRSGEVARRRNRKIASQVRQLLARARGEGSPEALLELVDVESARRGVLSQLENRRLALRLGRPHRKNWPWKPNGTCWGASARATSCQVSASSTSMNERPLDVSSTTDSATPLSSASPSGSRTNTGSLG
jgi:hypothetical protein